MSSTKDRMLVVGATVLCLFVLLAYSGVVRIPEVGGALNVREYRVIPRMNGSDGAAISPDGSTVVLAHTVWEGIGRGITRIEVRDVKSSRLLSTFPLPETADVESWSQRSRTRVRYCDAGRYLLASDWKNKVYIIDTMTYQMHGIIDLNAISLPDVVAGAPGAGDIYVAWDCAAQGNVAAFSLVGRKFGWGITRVFDLDQVKEVYSGIEALDSARADSVSVSPSGSSIALAVGDPFGASSVAVVDMRLRKATVVSAGGSDPLRAQRAFFVGESAIATGNGNFPEKGKPLLRVWDLASRSEPRSFGDPDQGAFRYFGASADGRVVFGFSAKQSRCAWCNYFRGSEQLSHVKFTLWDRSSGKVISHSPTLPVIRHTCPPPFGLGLGSCTAFDEEPELDLSQSGNAVLATWQSGGQPVVVFTVR